jgi:hypothetical protein
MTTRSFPHLGFDPAPGDVDATRTLARHLGNVSTELAGMTSDLGRISTDGWKGKAATAFQDHVSGDIHPLLKKANDSFQQASSALGSWVTQLQGFQSEADSLEREAASKQGDLDHAKSAAQSAAAQPPDPHATSADAQQAAAALKVKHQAVSDAGDALDDVRRRAHDLHDRYMSAAGAVGKHFDKAASIAPPKPGFWSRMVSDIESDWHDATQWVKDHADLFKVIADIASDLSAVFGVLAIITAAIEPLGAIFAGLALATSAVALVGDLIAKAAGADVSWLSIGMSALGVIPGIGVFAKGAKFAEAGEAAARAAKLGDEGFEVADASRMVSVGKTAENVTNAAAKFKVAGKSVALFGKQGGGLLKATTFGGRFQVLSEASYATGQKVGTAGLKMITGGRVDIDSMSALGKTIDSVAKIGPKAFSIHGQTQDFHNMTSQFDRSCAAH